MPRYINTDTYNALTEMREQSHKVLARLTPDIPAGDPHINECFNTLMSLSQELHTLEKSLWSEREPTAGKVSMELHDDELRHG